MLLTIDCGNTHVVFGIFDHSDLSYSWRIDTLATNNKEHFLETFKEKLKNLNITIKHIKYVILASVVNEAESCFNFFEKSLSIPILSISSSLLKLPIEIDLLQPSQVGADRLVNAVAGSSLTQSDVIIVDFGTATTFDIVTMVSGMPIYKGGIIAPGVNLSLDVLTRAASKLPKIDLSIHPSKVSVIGKNTVDAMWSGIIWGYVGLIEGIIHRIEVETGNSFRIIATGGLASLYLPYCELIKWQEPNLTLLGLKQIAEINGYR